MTSDKERREVAARLRAGHRRDGESQVTFIARMVKGSDRATVVDVLRLPERLADLIDRPTCHLVEDENGYTACSECGCTALYMLDASYCPDCGASVVRNGD